MTTSPLYPFEDEHERVERHCKLPLHIGTARMRGQAEIDHPLQMIFRQIQQKKGNRTPEPSDIAFDASFLVPAEGKCLIFLRNNFGVRLHRLFGEELQITGDGPDGEFTMTCPHFSVEATSAKDGPVAWAVASPVNCFATIQYGESRPVSRVTAILNNFDFEYRNWPSDFEHPNRESVLRVEAAGRFVDFAWREGRQRLRHLLDIGVLRTTALTSFSFEAWEGASDAQLQEFAYGIASMCGIVARQHTGVPVLAFQDESGRVITRILADAIESQFRGDYVLRHLHLDGGLPQLFRECFSEHMKMQASEMWNRLPAFCAEIHGPCYMEQKIASLMTALEFFLRASLIEAGPSKGKKPEDLMLSGLLGSAQRNLGWNIPKHYTAKDRHRFLRNAAVHGDCLPGAINQARHDFDKWWLFLMRRVLIRLGFTGEVASPHNGLAASSPVGDFSEEHNCFQT